MWGEPELSHVWEFDHMVFFHSHKSTLVTRGEEVKLKWNYNVRGRGEHRNLER